MEDKIKEAVEKAGSPSEVGGEGWSASIFGRGFIIILAKPLSLLRSRTCRSTASDVRCWQA